MARVQALTESSCIVTLGDTVDPGLSALVCALDRRVRQALGATVRDSVPSYASLHLSLDPTRLEIGPACRKIEALLETLDEAGPDPSPAQQIDIPVYYGEEVAPDLAAVAAATGLTPDEVVARHQGRVYRVYAIGFLPGFCFLGSVDEQLRLPRRETPRDRVPAGSVAIAEAQTAVYPRATPGGWHLIGRSPVDMLSLCQARDHPLGVGDEIRFVAIDRDAFQAAGGDLE